jgi:serine/threonine protein kinase
MEHFSLSRIGNYEVSRRLGKGAFAKVYEAKHRQLNVKVAVKVVNLKDMDDRYMKKWYKREAELLSQLNHPGIVALFEVMQSQNHFCMVLEYVGENLCDFIRKQNRGKLDEMLARCFSRQLVAAVSYMHRKQIIHRDIKLENILVNIRIKRVKLTDFGLSKSWDRINPLTTNCGSPEYASPELHNGKSYGPKVDIWAL